MKTRTRNLVGLGALVAAVVTCAALGQQPAGQVAAIVNGEAIALADVQKILKQTPGAEAKTVPETQQRQMQFEALQLLIDELLMQQFLRQSAPRVELAEVDQWLNKLRDSVKQQNRTMEDFYKESGETEAEIRADILKRLQRVAFVKEHLSDADVKKYYDDNRDFFDLVKVKASHILLRLPPTAPDNERLNARNKLLAIRQQIVGGQIDFAEAAKKFSQCPTAPNGGDLGGYFPRKFAVQEPFARAAFAMKPGEVSDVVQTDYGLHLIKVIDRRQDGPPSNFDKIKDEVREFAAEEMMQNLLAQLRQSAKITINLDAPQPVQPIQQAGK